MRHIDQFKFTAKCPEGYGSILLFQTALCIHQHRLQITRQVQVLHSMLDVLVFLEKQEQNLGELSSLLNFNDCSIWSTLESDCKYMHEKKLISLAHWYTISIIPINQFMILFLLYKSP